MQQRLYLDLDKDLCKSLWEIFRYIASMLSVQEKGSTTLKLGLEEGTVLVFRQDKKILSKDYEELKLPDFFKDVLRIGRETRLMDTGDDEITTVWLKLSNLGLWGCSFIPLTAYLLDDELIIDFPEFLKTNSQGLSQIIGSFSNWKELNVDRYKDIIYLAGNTYIICKGAECGILGVSISSVGNAARFYTKNLDRSYSLSCDSSIEAVNTLVNAVKTEFDVESIFLLNYFEFTGKAIAVKSNEVTGKKRLLIYLM